ncbi:MAG: hypothetical protein CVU38_16840 [Chloroflexi bacterium HGW-Chloroflexi-1]|nr:MAG: hypothetical protein CVU38_16840 [Chloroflexi bacterium HGW-Chloroflexi-1]
MNSDTSKRVQLQGVLDKTASWAGISADGSLIVELYDFSAEAARCFGNDVAFLLVISTEAKGEMLTRLTTGQLLP